MPATRVVIFREADGSVPLLDWLDELPMRAKAKCQVRIERLAERGHELRRPEADILRDGIYELRVVHGGVQYRILHFFHGRTVVVLSHGLIKKGARVPEREIDRAIDRKRMFGAIPDLHTFVGDV